MQAVMRKADDRPLTFAEKRRHQRAASKPTSLEIGIGEGLPRVTVAGYVDSEFGLMKEGDIIMSVSLGSKGGVQTLIWSRDRDSTEKLENALSQGLPLVIKFNSPNTSAGERLRKKRVLEELMTLRAIKQDSQICPKCTVRITRSAGCNHMNCTNCGTHFCYRCGVTLNPSDPYSHFKGSGCPTFDQEEVRRMVVEQRNDVDHELEELRRQFGRQEDLLERFQAHQIGQAPRNNGTASHRIRHEGQSSCPTCRQWNDRAGHLNHVRCHACRTSFCHHCGRRIQGVVTQHYRGEGACPQHSAD